MSEFVYPPPLNVDDPIFNFNNFVYYTSLPSGGGGGVGATGPTGLPGTAVNTGATGPWFHSD